MQFAEILRQSRSSPATVLHKFLLSYDPTTERVHAFVEGAPDLVFYRPFIERYVSPRVITMYNCGGKKQVYDAYARITARFPHCLRVIFLVDKDLDDIVGQPWPSDPRIFVTEFYSIENYVVSSDVLEKYFSDFVKIRIVAFDLGPALRRFDDQLKAFYKGILPVMAWILASRRAGHSPVLSNIDISRFISMSESGIARTRNSGRLNYLARVSGVSPAPSVLRQVRRSCAELRRLAPKRFIRGKFEGWFFVQFIKRLVEALSEVARQSGGSISVIVPLEDSNYIQLLVNYVAMPPSLGSFLTFHLRANQLAATETEREQPLWPIKLIRRWFNW